MMHEPEVEALRLKSLSLLEDIAHYNLVTQAWKFALILREMKDAEDDSVPWNGVNDGDDDEDDVTYLDEDAIEEVYPIEGLLSLLTGAEALVAVKELTSAWRTGRAAAASDIRISSAMKSIEDFLGGPGKIIRNPAGDPVIMREGKKIRFDINNPGEDVPHFHIERETPSGNWKDVGGEHRHYFTEIEEE